MHIFVSVWSVIEALLVSFGGVMVTWFFMTFGSSCWHLYMEEGGFLSHTFQVCLGRESASSQLSFEFHMCPRLRSWASGPAVRVYAGARPWPRLCMGQVSTG